MQEHGGFTVECLKALRSEVNIMLSDVDGLRVALELAKVHPEHLDMAAPVVGTVGAPAPEVAAAAAAAPSINQGLVSFQLKPPGMKGTDLFAHMIAFRRRTSLGAPIRPSALTGEVFMDDEQPALLFDLTPEDERLATLQATAMRGGGKKLAARKLNNMGHVNAWSGIANGPEELAKFKRRCQLMASVDQIDDAQRAAKKQKKSDDDAKLRQLARTAFVKLKKQAPLRQLTKLTVAELLSILHVAYPLADRKAANKGALVARVEQEIAKDERPLQEALAASSEATAAGDSILPALEAPKGSNGVGELDEAEFAEDEDEDDGEDAAVARRFADMDKSGVDDDSDDEQLRASGAGSAASAVGAARATRAGKARAAAASSSGRSFKCFIEPWEKSAIFARSGANERRLLAKYGGMQFIDKDEDNQPMYVICKENLEFVGGKHADPPQYGVFAEAQDDDEDTPLYLINDELIDDIAATRQDEGVELEPRERDEDMETSD